MFTSNEHDIYSGGSRGGGSGGLLEHPPPHVPRFLISYENEIIWSQRPNCFIFMGYIRKMRENQQSKPTPLYI